jgi:CMP-N-acetylneuraminic acid synthetase
MAIEIMATSIQKKITVFLPCRAGSQRVIKKNVKPFAGIVGGLTKIKLEQLVKINRVDTILVSTDDQEVKDIALSMGSKKIFIDDRPKHLATSATKTDELIDYVPGIIEDGIVLWTHVTSPFIGSTDYNSYIEAYERNLLNGNDSLMTVNRLHKFIWDYEKPVNYDRNIEKWPRTQTLPPMFEVNSGAFIADISIYKNLHDRIGLRPFMYELDELKAFDIDWELNFKTAEFFWLNNITL